jgi:hypothetical protein
MEARVGDFVRATIDALGAASLLASALFRALLTRAVSDATQSARRRLLTWLRCCAALQPRSCRPLPLPPPRRCSRSRLAALCNPPSQPRALR